MFLFFVQKFEKKPQTDSKNIQKTKNDSKNIQLQKSKSDWGEVCRFNIFVIVHFYISVQKSTQNVPQYIHQFNPDSTHANPNPISRSSNKRSHFTSIHGYR